MNKLTVLIILFSAFCKFSFATILEGQNKEYAWGKIIFKTYSDPVSKEEKKLFTIEFDKDGKFKTEVDINKPTFIFCEFGVYRGEFILEPGKTIQPIFPPLKEKSFADQKNPYFEPVLFWFKLENDEGVNKKILDFEIRFSELTNQKYFNQLYFKQSRAIYDSVLYFINKDFPKSDDRIFETHKLLKLKTLESEVFREKPEDNAASLQSISEDFWETPTFISFFERIFTNRLNFDSKEKNGAAIKTAVSQNDVQFLQQFVNEKYKLSGNIQKLAILKMLHDAYYSGEFSQQAILQMLRSEKWNANLNAELKQITKNVVEKLDFLRPGQKAPVICLQDIDGNDKCSDENNGKFKYLIFADAEMIVCQEHLKYLTKIEELFQKHLEIILVMRKTDIIKMKMFLDKNNVPGLQLVDENSKYIQEYKIKAFPTCFLLDENHKLLFDNTKAPLDGFEQQFGQFLQQELFRRQRNQSR